MKFPNEELALAVRINFEDGGGVENQPLYKQEAPTPPSQRDLVPVHRVEEREHRNLFARAWSCAAS